MARVGMDRIMSWLGIAAMTLLPLAGCMVIGPEPVGELPGERRAALSRLVVDNRTEHWLDISFRYAVGPGGEITVGRIAPDELAELAPVPAGEPILMAARGDSFERRIGPLTLEVGTTWTWVIRDDDHTDGP